MVSEPSVIADCATGRFFKDKSLKPFRGFTLIELLIVIAIILILIAIALPNFLEAQIRAKVTKARAEMRTLGIAMDAYLLDWDMYPPNHDPGEEDSGDMERGFFQLTTPIAYIGEIPTEPFVRRSGMANPGETGKYETYEMGSTGLRPLEAMFGIPIRGNIHMFCIESFGPDIDDDWGQNTEWPFNGPFPCQDGGNMLYYSATNGTKSSGDLLHRGGEYNNGSYCVDHWQHVRGKN